ncbi:GDSL-type esterase/lipase family protein [Actinomadura rupiterrae]|uniref:GDSL-type esterase/lipase family protein n=1 Tax=Actinomadura rupiterrae TaxID=559627 RepID=UPI0020A52FEC|nr:GDSL-type esterase/lipase family protein [Actinomadura rupiterrae]MCP2341556.1 hypothetical protein [Actinomadura rupiterrae]
MRPHKSLAALAAVLAAGSALSVAASPAHGAIRSAAAEQYIVMLGDSYASGEAARFRGNNASDLKMRCSRHNTDLAYKPTIGFGCHYDLTKVYEPGTEQEGQCHRSPDHAPIAVAASALDLKSKNFACSGASSPHIIDQPFKQQEVSQSRLLAAWLKSRPKVKAIVLSIGGNDLNLSDVAKECVKGYVKPDTAGASDRKRCHEWQNWLDGNYKGVLDGTKVPHWGIPTASGARGVPSAIKSVRKVMKDAGYGDGTYDFYLVSYPPPVPPSAQVIKSGWAWRVKTGSCPLSTRDDEGHRDDFTWFNTFAKKLNAGLGSIAAAQHVRFMDQGHALDGHLLCQQGTEHPENAAQAGSDRKSEWVRFVTYHIAPLPSQGSPQEPLHPNYWGQAALGNCYAQMIRSEYTAASCINNETSNHQTLRNDSTTRPSAR